MPRPITPAPTAIPAMAPVDSSPDVLLLSDMVLLLLPAGSSTSGNDVNVATAGVVLDVVDMDGGSVVVVEDGSVSSAVDMLKKAEENEFLAD